jgi:hypothetical protein
VKKKIRAANSLNLKKKNWSAGAVDFFFVVARDFSPHKRRGTREAAQPFFQSKTSLLAQCPL